MKIDFNSNIFVQLIQRSDYFYTTNFDQYSHFLEHRFTESELGKLSKTIQSLMLTAQDLVTKQEMVNLFEPVEKTRKLEIGKSKLIETSLHYHVSIFDSVMSSPLTENYLKHQLIDKNKYSRTFVWNLILPFIYPILMILSICSPKIRNIYSVYPHSAYSEWIGHVWMTGVLLCLQFLPDAFQKIKYADLLFYLILRLVRRFSTVY